MSVSTLLWILLGLLWLQVLNLSFSSILSLFLGVVSAGVQFHFFSPGPVHFSQHRVWERQALLRRTLLPPWSDEALSSIFLFLKR